MVVRESMEWGGVEISLETGNLAKQAHGSVVVRCGENVVLAASVGSEEAREGQAFFPLMVEYRENYYAAGRFPGGFFKREGRLGTKETITSRLIDRPLRPMFDDGYMGETQVTALVMSSDGVRDTDIFGMVGCLAATYLSPLPFSTPMSAARVGLVDGQFILNPTFEQREESILDLTVAATKDSIVMVEAGAEFVTETEMVDALAFAHEEIRKMIGLIENMAEQMNLEKWKIEPPEVDQEMLSGLRQRIESDLVAALTTKGKRNSDKAVKAVKVSLIESFDEEDPNREKAAELFGRIKEDIFRDYLLNQKKRTDGRDFDEVRPLSIEVGFLPRTHGSAVFTRGETQALVTATLGTSSDAQIVDEIVNESKKHFMLHYNFPSFSVGEVRPSRGPGRREIGHGLLAERALRPVIPDRDAFPYTIRLVSDILESNGSSSMASVCGGSLALFDAGIPASRPVAGVAMGLVQEGSNYAILTDIQGAEDHYGDMDFKVTGSDEGITALQMDIKIKGLDREILAQALDQAREGRLFILSKMNEALAQPRKGFAENAPQIAIIMVPVEKIRDVIGPGGKVIRSIVEKTGAKIDIEDSGRCFISAPDKASGEVAKKMVEDLIAVPEAGKSYLGKITRITDFGAFVEILPGTEGLLHISEIANYRVRRVTDELSEGEEIMVKVLSVESNGKMRLSRKALLVG